MSCRSTPAPASAAIPAIPAIPAITAILVASLCTAGGCCRIGSLWDGALNAIDGDCGQHETLAKLGITAKNYEGDGCVHWGLVHRLSPPAGSPESVANEDRVTITFASLAVGMRGQDWPPGDSSRGDVYLPVLLPKQDRHRKVCVEFRGRFHVSDAEGELPWVALRYSAGDGTAQYLPLHNSLKPGEWQNLPLREAGPAKTKDCKAGNDDRTKGDGKGCVEDPAADGSGGRVCFQTIPSWGEPNQCDFSFRIRQEVNVPTEPGAEKEDRLRRFPVSIRLYPSNYTGTMPPRPTWIKVDSVTMWFPKSQ